MSALLRHNVALQRLELIDCKFTEAAVKDWASQLVENKYTGLTVFTLHSRKELPRNREIAAKLAELIACWRFEGPMCTRLHT